MGQIMSTTAIIGSAIRRGLRGSKRLSIFWLLNALFAGVISLNYFSRLGTDFSFLSGIYCVLATLGHFASFALAGWVVLAFLPACIFRRRGERVAWILSATVCVAGTLILLADTFVYGLFRFHVYNKFVLDMLFSQDADGIFVFSAGQYFLMFLLLAVLLGLQFLVFYLSGKIVPAIGKKIAFTLAGIFVFSFVASNLMYAYCSATATAAVPAIASVYPAYFPLTANSFLVSHGFVDPEKVRERTKWNEGTALNYPKHPITLESEPTKNILIILLDSWSFRSYTPEVMPNVCKFAEGAQVFENHYSGDHGTRTGVPSLFHGLPGLYYDAILGGAVPAAFIDVLVREKYDFGIFSCAGLSSPPFDRTIFSTVPDKLHDSFSDRAGNVPGGDAALTGAWISWLADWQKKNPAGEKKFFGFLFYDLLHAMTLPRKSPKKFSPTWSNAHYELLDEDTDSTEFWNLYLNDAVFDDEQIARVLEDLRARGLLENTIVIITGDHGQEFNETGQNFWTHGSAFSEPQMHVPLIIFDASLPPKTFMHWTAHYDVSVTIMQNYLHATNPPSDYSVGKNLFDETPREWLLVGHEEQFGVIEKDRITRTRLGATCEIFDRDYKPLPDAKLNVPVLREALEQAQEFYKK